MTAPSQPLRSLLTSFITTAIVLSLTTACGNGDSDTNSGGDMIDDENVSFARNKVPEIEAALASPDPGSATGACAVVKMDLPGIRKADKKLAAKIEKLCGHDYSIRALTVMVERAEAARAKDPNDHRECGSWDIFLKPVIETKAGGDPAIALLEARYTKVCPGKI